MTNTDPKDRILDAAEQAFAEKGLAGARVQAIALAAEVNKASLYYYYQSKESLYQAVLSRVIGQVFESVRAELSREHPAPADQVNAVLDGYRAVLDHHPAFARIMARELAEGAPVAGPLLREKMAPMLPQLQGVLLAAAASGAFNPTLTTPLLGPVLVAPVIFYALASPVLLSVFGPEVGDAYHELVKQVVVNGLRKREDSPCT